MLAVLLFMAIYGLGFFLAQKVEPDHIYESFQKVFSDTELEAKNQTDFLSRNFDTSSNVAGFRNPGLESLRIGKNNGLSFFVYKHDSLIYWGDNKIILPAEVIRQNAGQDFVLKLKTGWYWFHGKRAGSFLFLCSFPLRNEYPFQNEYLTNGFSSRFNFPELFSLASGHGKFPVYSQNHTCLFSLNFAGNSEAAAADPSGSKDRTRRHLPAGFLFLLFVLAMLSLVQCIYLFYAGIPWFAARKFIMNLSFFITVLLLRVIQLVLHFPSELYHTELFGPSWYSSSVILPSLGDFAINMLLVFAMALVLFKHSSFKPAAGKIHPAKLVLVTAPAIFTLLVGFQTVGYLLTGLVINSSLPLNLQNISALVPESAYGLLIVCSILFSFGLLSTRVFPGIFSDAMPKELILLSAAIAAGGNILILNVLNVELYSLEYLFFFICFFACWFMLARGANLFTARNMLFFLCFYAVFTTLVLNRANGQKEHEKLNLLAVKLASRRNPVTEVLYEQLEHKLLADSLLRTAFQPAAAGQGVSATNLVAWLKKQYFRDYWRKYNIQVTLCDTMKDLKIQPQGYLVNCNTYFNGIIRNYGEETILPNLTFLDYGLGKEYYLIILDGRDFGLAGATTQTLYIEINLKDSSPEQGYPGLLMDNTRMDLPDLSDYSYGLFQNGRLVHAVGGYSYYTLLSQYKDFSPAQTSFSGDRMTHYQYHINSSTSLLISKKEETLLTAATPFSYLFILFALVTFLAAGMFNYQRKTQILPNSLRNRLHISLTGILVVALLAIGIVQVINIIDLNTKKNTANLRERAWSVMVEMQHKYNMAKETRDIPKNELDDFLVRLSNVFFTDINFYDSRGMLVSSSRPPIFEEGLVSERMDPVACQKLVADHKPIFIHSESIGSMQFSSAYLPFYNEQNNLLGYVNLPYFSRQDELKKEISTFLVTFINIYILLILFGIFITILVSNYITAPLALLAAKMSQLRLGRVNEKIFWNKHDEIGQLVTEYNRMIDELGRSAGMLAQSERESAWREMARQVAHEIKNPLTPMKLSAQYLQKAWHDKAPDWEQRLARFTNTLVEQIDTLSAIASNFSDFAKMPAIVLESVDIEDVVKFSLSLYQDTSVIRYEFHANGPVARVLADRSQLVRVFTNLLNNAVQAIGVDKVGIIGIRLYNDRKFVVVEISDNGAGIPPDRADRIFQPDFTTKTGGMGLGLAIVKGIIDGMQGEISFTSEEHKGTTFIIKIPANADQTQQQPG